MTTFTRRNLLTATLALTAAGSAGLAGLRGARASTVHEVTISGFAFDPAELTIAVGDTVRFTNTDNAPHDATADDGSFATARLGNGESDEVTFETAGTFEYHCSIHTHMRAVIHVEG